MNKVIVIGAGIGGLSTAIRLRARGWDVTVLEQQSGPGGKIGEIRHKGFRWDTGPSLFTLPEMVTDLFALAGEDPEQWFLYRRLDTICRYTFADGTIINAPANIDQLADMLHKTGISTPGEVNRFFRRSAEIYRLTAPVFLFNSFQNPALYWSKAFWRSVLQSWKLGAMNTMHRANLRFFSDARMVQMMDRFATYNGSDPYKAPATLNCIPHLEHQLGTFFPEKGMYGIVSSLFALAQKMGVDFRFDTPAEMVDKQPDGSFIVNAGDVILQASVVVSDVDLSSFSKIVRLPIAAKYLRQQRSSSAIVFYWAMDTTFPKLELHNIFFAENYKAEFDGLFRTKIPADDLTVYVYVSSKVVPADAPDGCENWFVMVNAPENVGQDWTSIISKVRSSVLRKLEASLGCPVGTHITNEYVRDPVSIEQFTGSAGGSLYGNSSNNRFAAFLRHPNRYPSVRGLYFTGGSVHPGGGIPLCLSSAKLVEQAVCRHFRKA